MSFSEFVPCPDIPVTRSLSSNNSVDPVECHKKCVEQQLNPVYTALRGITWKQMYRALLVSTFNVLHDPDLTITIFNRKRINRGAVR